MATHKLGQKERGRGANAGTEGMTDNAAAPANERGWTESKKTSARIKFSCLSYK